MLLLFVTFHPCHKLKLLVRQTYPNLRIPTKKKLKAIIKHPKSSGRFATNQTTSKLFFCTHLHQGCIGLPWSPWPCHQGNSCCGHRCCCRCLSVARSGVCDSGSAQGGGSIGSRCARCHEGAERGSQETSQGGSDGHRFCHGDGWS